jgi:hypothetical protein
MLQVMERLATTTFDTPVLLMIFNRLETTKRVLDEIRQIRPKKFFIASDGPRKGKVDEIDQVDKVRRYVLDNINWPCEVQTLFRDENLGCGVAPYTAITWFFERVEQGIILEDDCLPLPGFFKFCEEMLNYYKDDERIYEISGTNLQAGNVREDGSYYFSNYGGIWGWATWARAWRKYDYYMTDLDKFLEEKRLKNILQEDRQVNYWEAQFVNASKLGSWWDYQWVYTIWNNNGVCIVPNVNLIENIGFDSNGTHTTGKPVWYDKATNGQFKIETIKHPSSFLVCKKADDFQFNISIKPERSFPAKLLGLIKKLTNV